MPASNFFPKQLGEVAEGKLKQKAKQHQSKHFHTLSNQTTEFEGVQSKLQSILNYRSDNKRLETELSVKKYKIKVFQVDFIDNLFNYNELKNLYQKFW